MYSSPRRPVPSTAALRVLRQLAYISSGTVCGAAALIAEERRRRTHVARKIVENSRKLKQHPRYAHAAAAPRPEPVQYTPDLDPALYGAETGIQEIGGVAEHSSHVPGDAGSSAGDGSRGGSERTAGLTGSDSQAAPVKHSRVRPEVDAFRDGILPSEVDKGYGRLTKLRSQREKSQSSGNAGHAQSNKTDGLRPHASSKAAMSDSAAFGSSLANSALRIKVRDMITFELGSGKHDQAYSRLLMFNQYHQSESSLSKGEAHRHAASVLSPDLASLPRQSTSPSPKDVDQLVSVFLSLFSVGPDCADVIPVVLASRLIDVAVKAGSLSALEDITSWLQRGSHLNVNHLEQICLNCPTVLSRNDAKLTSLFYTDLLLDEKLREIGDVAFYKLMVAGSILDARPDLRTYSDALIESVKSHTALNAQKTLFRCCRELIELNRHSAAARLMNHCHYHMPPTLQPEMNNRSVIAQELFHHLLRHDDLEQCAIALKYMDQSEPTFASKLHQLARLCKQRGAYKVLYRLHYRYNRQYEFATELYPAICSAYANFSTVATAKLFMRDIRCPRNDSILDACKPAWAAILERSWRDTRNFSAVAQLFDEMRQLSGKHNFDISLYNAMIRVCLRAGKVSEAESFLRQMQVEAGIQPDLTTFGHFVVSTAKAQDWPAVERLLSMLDDIAAAEGATSTWEHFFTPVLLEYVKSHDPSKIWSFVAGAIETGKIIPTPAINNILLESFVHGERLDMIPLWFTYLETCGHATELDAETAVRMIRRFYYDTRPSNIVMMWLCRSLVHSVPGLGSEKLKSLLRESIAHDMRHLGTGPNASRMYKEAYQRLMMLACSPKDSLPKPFPSEEELQDVDSGYASERSMSAAEHDSVSDRQVEGEILLSLSLGRPSDAVEFYKRSVTASGLPHSSLSLEAAIAASLRARGGDATEAEELLSSAQDAGLNVSSVLMPLLLARIKGNTCDGQALKLEDMETSVIDFYRTMDENNIYAGHHVVTTAASVLIKLGQPKRGISLLRSVFESPWNSALKKPFDTPAMTVFLQGYVKMGHEEGIDWTMNHVLENQMRIDNPLIKVLKRACTHFRLASVQLKDERLEHLSYKMADFRRVCKDRNMKQIAAASRFGNKLVRCMAVAARKETQTPKDLAALASFQHEMSQQKQQESHLSEPDACQELHVDLAAPEWKQSTTTRKDFKDIFNIPEPTLIGTKDDTVERRGLQKGPARLSKAALREHKVSLQKGWQDEDGRRLNFKYISAVDGE